MKRIFKTLFIALILTVSHTNPAFADNTPPAVDEEEEMEEAMDELTGAEKAAVGAFVSGLRKRSSTSKPSTKPAPEAAPKLAPKAVAKPVVATESKNWFHLGLFKNVDAKLSPGLALGFIYKEVTVGALAHKREVYKGRDGILMKGLFVEVPFASWFYARGAFNKGQTGSEEVVISAGSLAVGVKWQVFKHLALSLDVADFTSTHTETMVLANGGFFGDTGFFNSKEKEVTKDLKFSGPSMIKFSFDL